MSTQELHELAEQAADYARAYCFFDGRLGADLEVATTQIILAHDIANRGGYILRSDKGADYLTLWVKMPGSDPVTIHFDRTCPVGGVDISIHPTAQYAENSQEPI